MTINRSCQQAIWQNINSHMDELQRLESQLREKDKQREDLRQQIEAKQRVIEQATGLTWAQVAASITSPPARRHSGQNRNARSRTTSSTKSERNVRAWVLCAIAHYEDENPKSRIDENSIRIFINAKVPGFLDHHSPNVLFGALNALKNKGFIITTPSRGANHDRSQYRLTALGRASLI